MNDWRHERPENMIHVHEREESRAAQLFATGDCYRHSYGSDGRGGGVCRDCGDTIGVDEL